MTVLVSSQLKSIWFPMILLLLFSFSCENEEYEPKPGCEINEGIAAVITGEDRRRCACCGGYFIEAADSTYRFQQFPDCSEIEFLGDDANYPIPVTIEFRVDLNSCIGDEIFLEKLEKR